MCSEVFLCPQRWWASLPFSVDIFLTEPPSPPTWEQGIKAFSSFGSEPCLSSPPRSGQSSNSTSRRRRTFSPQMSWGPTTWATLFLYLMTHPRMWDRNPLEPICFLYSSGRGQDSTPILVPPGPRLPATPLCPMPKAHACPCRLLTARNCLTAKLMKEYLTRRSLFFT